MIPALPVSLRRSLTRNSSLLNTIRIFGSPQLSVNSWLNNSTRRKAMSSADTVPPEVAKAGPTEPIIVLASQSPNRLSLCKQIGINPIVRISDFEENLSKELTVREFVEQTAKGKLDVVEREMREKKEPFDVIIASDTVIYFDGEIIGKPIDSEDAVKTLQRLRQNTHYVYSGVAMAFKDGSQELFHSETKVHFGDYSDELIKDYVNTGEPLNKAGSYGIQNRGAVFVSSIAGCFSNVVGLPLNAVSQALMKKGIQFMNN